MVVVPLWGFLWLTARKLLATSYTNGSSLHNGNGPLGPSCESGWFCDRATRRMTMSADGKCRPDVLQFGFGNSPNSF